MPHLRGKSLVDMGCGLGVWGYLTGVATEDEVYIVGVDTWPKYLYHVKRHKIYDDVILADVRFPPFRDKSFSAVLSCEVIEHLPKSDGYKFLKEVERIAKEKIVLTTPNSEGLRKKEPHPESHRSSWSLKEFKRAGFKVYGMGFRYTRLHSPRLPPRLKSVMFYLSTPLTYIVPKMGDILIAVKELEGE